jgi:hypothetical protein
MLTLPIDGTRRLWFGRIRRPYAFRCPVVAGEYALLLVVGDDDISSDEQARLSEQFVRSGCRYAVCFGPSSSSWDDSIDMVGVMDEVDGRPSALVMTTWHDHEPIDETVDYFASNTESGGWSPQQFVVLVLGGTDEFEQSVLDAVRNRFC